MTYVAFLVGLMIGFVAGVVAEQGFLQYAGTEDRTHDREER